MKEELPRAIKSGLISDDDEVIGETHVTNARKGKEAASKIEDRGRGRNNRFDAFS
jgi:hypothetical protein